MIIVWLPIYIASRSERHAKLGEEIEGTEQKKIMWTRRNFSGSGKLQLRLRSILTQTKSKKWKEATITITTTKTWATAPRFYHLICSVRRSFMAANNWTIIMDIWLHNNQWEPFYFSAHFINRGIVGEHSHAHAFVCVRAFCVRACVHLCVLMRCLRSPK